MTNPNVPFTGQPGQQGTTGSSGPLGGTPLAAPGPTPNPLHDQRPNAQFPTLNPPTIKTAIYAPDVTILVAHDGQTFDISQDVVRGQIVRKENSASSLFVTLANPHLRYTSGEAKFSRMDRITAYLTRTTKIQVFSGYLDTIPWIQTYPGTVDLRATCTLKRLLHTWWNPALPDSQRYFDQIDNNVGTDSGIGSILRNIMRDVGHWPDASVHIQNFPMKFITFLNNYFLSTNMAAKNEKLGQSFSALLLGDDTSPGPMGAVGYRASDPVGTASTAANAPDFILSQIVAACDQRGMGPIVDVTANSQTIAQAANVFESAPASANPIDMPLAKDVQQAGQQVAQYSSNWSTQNANSDAAILAVAAATVETGMQIMANNTDPATLTYAYTGINANGSGAGLFLMPNTGEWGTPAQRMNPLASAAMFFDKLNSITGWRNMDGGQAIWLVLQTVSSSIQLFDAAITAAAKTVQAYRQATQGASNAANLAAGAIPGGAGGIGGLMGGGANPISSAGSALGGATTSPVSSAAGTLATGRPVPDSEGAINAGMTIVGTPYQYGGNSIATGIDCSKFVQLSFAAIGFDVGRDTGNERGKVPSIPGSAAQRGDIIQPGPEAGGHTGIYLGNGTMLDTGGPTGVGGGIHPVNPATAFWVGRVCQNGGPGPAPFTPITGAGVGTALSAPGTGIPVGTGSGGPLGGGGGSNTGSEPIARNLFSYIFQPVNYATALADFLGGEKAYIDSQPLMQTIKALCMASLRNFQSAPNGDFMAYYPDPFGMDGKPAILALEDIELKDCHIDLSDDNLTTHVYIEGDYTMVGEADSAVGWLTTSGVATVENQQLYQMLTKIAPGDVDSNMSAQQLISRFGVRPYKDSYQIAGNGALEFLLACQIFMGKWASQYETDIGMTFMPELFPGMRVFMVGHNLTVYCSQVTHTFDWEHGFTTAATVNAAADAIAASRIFSSVPGFLNPTSTNPTGGGNTTNTGQGVLGNLITSGPGFAPPAPNTPLTDPGPSG